ncbi:MAG: ROK family protein [Phycisphaerae bacterium]|nr:ROK family protein [Phycisphaerae bacterium]
MHKQFYLGWDIGGTKSAAIVGTPDGQIVARIPWPSQVQRGPDAMIADFLGAACQLRQDYPIAAVGVAVGGPLDADRGIVLGPPNLPRWDNIPLRQRLMQALDLPVRVVHDAAACALAEHFWGAGRGVSHLAYLTCGTGFGAGLILGGKAYQGAGGLSPEIGHFQLRPDGPVAFGVRGSAEAYCSAQALAGLAIWLYPSRFAHQPPPPADIAALAAAADPDAMHILQTSAHAVGDICALLSDLLRLELIVIGSLATYLGETWLNQVRSRFAEKSLDGGHRCRIVPAGLADRLQDCSALAAAASGQPDDAMPDSTSGGDHGPHHEHLTAETNS